MTKNTLVYSFVGSAALAATAFAGTAPSAKCAKCVAPVAAADEDLGLTLSVGYDSKYIFRGVDFANDWVTTSLDWTLPLTDKIRLETGASYGISAGDSAAGLGLSYQRLELNTGIVADLGGVELGLGYRWYQHEGDLANFLEDGHEVGLTVATKVGPLNFGLGGYYDFAIDGWYLEAAVNTEIKLCERASLVPGVSVGYGIDYSWHTPVKLNDGFTAVNVSLALPIKLTKRATLTPFIAANLPIDTLDDAGEDNQLHGGVSLSVKF